MSIFREQYAELKEEEINEAYYKACLTSNFELIKFLLTSKEIAINDDINYSNAIGNNAKTINMFLNRDLNKELDSSTIKQNLPKI